MAHTRTWSETTPADTDLAKNGARDMRYVRVDLKERLALEHSMAADDNDGRHLEGSARAYVDAAEPTPPTGLEEGRLWLDSDDNALKVHNGTSFVGVKAASAPVAGSGVFTAAAVSSGDGGTPITLQSVNIVSSGGQLHIQATGLAKLQNISGSNPSIYYLYRDSTLLCSSEVLPPGTLAIQLPIALSYFDTPAAGTYNYYFKVSKTGIQGAHTTENRALSVIEAIG